MAAIASFRAGGWADTNIATNAWNATPPTNVDTVTITHAVTIDTLDCVCDALTINAGGNLVASQVANSKLVIDKGITQAASATAAVNLDMSAVPQYTCTLQINKDGDATANNTTNVWSVLGPMTLKGATKTRATFTDGALTGNTATQCDVDDATGWQVGDMLVFAMTQQATDTIIVNGVTNPGTGYIEVSTASAHGMVVGDDVVLTQLQTALNAITFTINAVPTTTTFRIPYGALTITDTAGACSRQARTDLVTIATLTAVGGGAYSGSGPATVTWADGTGTGGAVRHDHADDCLVGNLTRNVVMTSGNALSKLLLTFGGGSAYVRPIDNVMFRDFYGVSAFPSGALAFTGARVGNITNCVFYEWYGTVQTSSNAAAAVDPRQYNTYYSTKSGAALFNHGNQASLIGPEEYPIILRMTNTSSNSANVNWSNGYLLEPWISGVCGSSSSGSTNAAALRLMPSGEKCIVGGAVWSCTGVMVTEQGGSGISAPAVFNGTRFGIGPPGVVADYSANNRLLLTSAGPQTVLFDSCPLGSGHPLHQSIGAGQTVIYKNKSNDAAVQEIYKNSSITVPVMSRVTAAGDISNSPSSLMMEWTGAGAYEHTRNINVLVSAGETKTALIRAKKNASYGSSTRPKVTAYDGSTVASMATLSDSTNTWETLTLSITNASAADKEYRVEFYGKSAVNGAKCWFSGIPLAPFITRCRHYGYVFDEGSATRTVDVYSSAVEATALVYTGVTLNNTTKQISFAAGTADTMQKFYDYSRAWCVEDTLRDVPLLRAGTLFDLDADWTVVDPYYTNTATWGTGTVKLTTTGSKTLAISGATVQLTATGAYDLSVCTLSGTIAFTTDTGARVVTVTVPNGISYTTEGSNITVITPSVSRGLDFDNVPTGATVVVFNTGAQTVINTPTGPNWIWSEAGGSDLIVDYTIQKVGFLGVRRTGVTVNSAVLVTDGSLLEDRSYAASSGLTFGTNCFANPATKKFGLTVASSLQNFYCKMREAWIVESTLQNKPFPLVANGPNSFTLTDDWEWDLTTYPNSITLLKRDGMRYTNSSGVVTAIWAALMSNDVPAGLQVRYQQRDGLGTTNTLTTGNIDQLIQIYGDATHGNFDYTNWLVLKVQAEGYDQAEAVVLDIYPQLDDQLFVVGLKPTVNNIAAQAGITGVTIYSEPTPILWNGQYFSTTITDTTDTHSGLQIMQYVRSLNNFNLHDMIRANGAKFKTVTGNVYGDTLTTPAGVRVVKADGTTPHPDFDLFISDSGGSYVPDVVAPITWAGALNGTTVLLYNDSSVGSPIIDTQIVSGAGGYDWTISLPHVDVAIGDSLRLRFGHKEYYAGELQGTMTASGLTFVGSMILHPIYAGWGLNGATYDQANGGSFTMDGTNLQIDIDNSVTTGLKKALGAWTQYLMTLPAGLDTFYRAWDLLELNQIRQNVDIIGVLLDLPVSGAQFAFTDNEVNYYRSDFTLPYNIETGHGNIFMTYNAKPFVATTASAYAITGDIDEVAAKVQIGLTAQGYTSVRAPLLDNLDAAVSDGSAIAVIDAATAAGGMPSNVTHTNGELMIGNGSAADKFRSHLVP